MNTAALVLCILIAMAQLNSGSGFFFSSLGLGMEETTEESVTEIFETTPAPTTPDGQDAAGILLDVDNFPGSRLKRQSAPTSQAARFKKLMRLIDAANLQDCAGRVVCDLNCNPDSFGSDGKRVLSMLTQLQTSGHIERQDMEFYVRAGVLGRKTSSRKDCLHVCLKSYPVCPAESKDLVSVASLIRLRL